MGSPFPGMDPYLEGDLWQEFHETLASAIRARLMPFLAPTYVALLAKRDVLDRPALGVFDVPPPRTIYPDVHGVQTRRESVAAVAVADAPGVMAPSVEAPLDLQAAVADCFDLVGYERLTDYALPPPPPELPLADAAWVETTRRAAGLRVP